MPKCIECHYYNADIPDCNAPGFNSPIRRVTLSRRCIFALLAQNVKKIHGKVLEIGYGKVSYLRRRIRKKAEWYGLEPRWEAEPKDNKFKGSASKMPFPKEMFDCVVCSQCMEHWGEYQDTVSSGLKEIHRVLKPNGVFFVDVPIHSHGGELFVKGDLDAIKKEFSEDMWKIEMFEEWRKEYDPLPQIRPPKKYHAYAKENSKQQVPSEWLLSISVVKI